MKWGPTLAGIFAATILPFLAVLLAVLWFATPGHSEGWTTEDPELSAWFQTEAARRCCDLRDAYLADEIATDAEGNLYAVITDGSADPAHDKPTIPNGTKIRIYEMQIRTEKGPPGHGMIFLQKGDQPPEQRWVFCYFFPNLG